MESAFVAVLEGLHESVTWTVKADVPYAVGVPLTAPVDALRDRPAGQDPALNDHASGVAPPVAARVAEYATPCWPSESDAVVMVRSAGITVMERLLVAEFAGVQASVARTVKLAVP